MDNIILQDRSNKIFKTIQDFEFLFAEEFEKCGINKCGHCNATGFTDKHMTSQCSNCGGMGYIGFEKLRGEFVCRTCNGYGCIICDYKGTVDWVTHATNFDAPPILRGRVL